MSDENEDPIVAILTVRQTKNHGKFKLHRLNRLIKEKGVRKVMDSIMQFGLMTFQPVICDRDMHIIDGQNRWEACKRLGRNVYYTQSSEVRIENLFAMNSARTDWEKCDWLHHYAQKGDINYLNARRLMEEFDLTSAEFLEISGVAKSKGEVQKGTMKFDLEKRRKIILERLSLIRETIEFLSKVQPQYKSDFIKSLSLKRGIIQVSNAKNFNADVFIRKLKLRGSTVCHCSGYKEYAKLFVQMYNHSNKTPICLEYRKISKEKQEIVEA